VQTRRPDDARIQKSSSAQGKLIILLEAGCGWVHNERRFPREPRLKRRETARKAVTLRTIFFARETSKGV